MQAVPWPSGRVQPACIRTARNHRYVCGRCARFAGFGRDVDRQARPHKTIGVFVHGYNYSFQEALYRLAQMAADSDIDSVPILFAWPSQATLTGYVADREAVLYSRDYLAAMLISLAKDKSADEILLFGHSMGGFLIMETLRQLKMEGHEEVLARLRVILAAPDIDADVFRKQIEVIGKLDPPLTVLVSTDDRALYASSLLDADNQRVGRLDINDPKIRDAATQHGVQVVDISSQKTTDTFRHDRYASLAKLYPALASLDRPKGNSQVGRVGAFVLDAAGATISSPFRLVSQVISPR